MIGANTSTLSQFVKILIIAPEIAPFAKVGGLADVTGTLPKALEQLGHDVKVVCPLYGTIRRDESWIPEGKPLCVPMGTGIRYARVWERHMPGSNVPAYFIEYDEFFARPEIYEGPWGWHSDNDRRFGFFSRAALELCFWMDWMPDVVHVHDWPTGLVPVMLNTVYAGTPLGRAASVMTIHNIQHQGYCDHSIIGFLGLPEWLFRADHIEAMGAVSMLKGGIFHATKITTVSPTYAKEIQGTIGGQGLNGILTFRASDLIGVLNGIDTSVWNPATDPTLPAKYDPANLGPKTDCKNYLCQRFGLRYNQQTPIYGVVSRLYEQKGLDLLKAIVARLMEKLDIQIVVLGTGESDLEYAFSDFHGRYSGRFATWIGFDDTRAHLVYAGADFLLMPSRFEPCGLGQMYAMTYGTIPVVRNTGGLADTVRQYDEKDGSGTGFLFNDPTPDALYEAIERSSKVWREHPDRIRAMQERDMKQDYSWDTSANAYANVYRWAIETRLGMNMEAASSASAVQQ
jgi:starch synthase